MTDIRYYRAGVEEPVRVARRPDDRPLRRTGRVRLALALLVVAAAVVLSALYGPRVSGDTFVALSFLHHLRRVPHWTPDALVVAAAVLFVLGAWTLAFGRRRLVAAVSVALLVALFAAPGVALGWASGFVGQMGHGGSAEKRSTVAKAQTVLQRPMPNRPINILLLGTDQAVPGNPGRSDSQILVRLDPQTKTISMLSLPRDLRWDIPGVGWAKMNSAYTYGGVKLAIQTFEDITGVPIHHFIRVNFSGFWHIVDVLHGVYLPVDHRYYNPKGTGFQPINIQPGYQLLKAKDALKFVRFRHDQEGDFTRMVRQQMFLREVQRQAMRWSGNWTMMVKMVRAIAGATTTDLDSLDKLLPIVDMVTSLNTAHIYQVHLEGSTPTIGGIDYVVDTPAQIAQAVHEFEHPPVPHTAASKPATAASGAAVSASPSVSSPTPSPSASPARSSRRATASTVYDWSGWKALAQKTSLTLEAPTTWAPGLAWDTAGVPFRAYSVVTPQGRHVKAAIAVGTVSFVGGVTEYWGVQALQWADPPAIADPSATRTIAGRTYLLFDQDRALHMVAWHENGATYWVINTLDNVLTNHQMLTLAESCAPIRS